MNFNAHIKEIPDFPKKGILFRDIAPLMKDPLLWEKVIDELSIYIKKIKPNYIAGIEARGFIIGSALATVNKVGFIPIRKRGKLAGETISTEYSLEYGIDKLEIQLNSFPSGSTILIIDDLLATGGTVQAAQRLVELSKGMVVGYCFIVELINLNGREKLSRHVPVKSIVKYY